MRQLVHYYETDKDFLAWTQKHKIVNSDKLLIEINFPNSDQNKLQTLLSNLEKIFPRQPSLVCRVLPLL